MKSKAATIPETSRQMIVTKFHGKDVSPNSRPKRKSRVPATMKKAPNPVNGCQALENRRLGNCEIKKEENDKEGQSIKRNVDIEIPPPCHLGREYSSCYTKYVKYVIYIRDGEAREPRNEVIYSETRDRASPVTPPKIGFRPKMSDILPHRGVDVAAAARR